MGCNCKKTAHNVAKYTNDNTIDELTGARKIAFGIRKIVTIVLVILVFIFATPFVIMYGIIRIIRGKSLRINVSKIIKLFHVRS